MEACFGPYHREMDKDDNEAAPAVYWCFRFPCGLPVGLTLYDYDYGLVVNSDAPEIDHLIRHIHLPVVPCWRKDLSDPATADRWRQMHAWLKEKHGTPAEWDSAWELWRQDDNGHREPMQRFRWYRDAGCMRDTYERRGHKQTYWLERCDLQQL